MNPKKNNPTENKKLILSVNLLLYSRIFTDQPTVTIIFQKTAVLILLLQHFCGFTLTIIYLSPPKPCKRE